MASGFIVNTTVLSPIPTTFDKVKLAEHRSGATSDVRSSALPNASSMSQLDLRITSYGTETFDVFLSWDSDGREPITSMVEEVSLTSRVGLSGVGHTVISMDKLFIAAPSAQTATGEIYLWIRASSGTQPVLDMARVHWHDET
tara:strand:- start:202 stop:630 length:429 start_codon:yes stop_codon:yes gene_type:complete